MSDAAVAEPSAEADAAAAEWAAALAEAEREVAELEAAEEAARAAGLAPTTAAAAAPTRGSAARGRLRAFRRLATRLGVTAVAGAIAGFVVTAALVLTGLLAPPGAGVPVEEPPKVLDLEAADTLIRAGRLEDAVTLLQAGRPGPEVPAGTVPYRVGLCLEGLGRWSEADEAYRRAAEASGGVGVVAAAAGVGRARCAASAGDLASAADLLGRVELQPADPVGPGRVVRAECLHLRARLEVAAAGPPAEPDPGNPDVRAWAPLGAMTPDYLDRLLPGGPGSPPRQGAEPAAADRQGAAESGPSAALRRALDFAPDHPDAPAVRLALANLDGAAGRAAEARRAYQQLLTGPAGSPAAVCAAYNLALLDLRAGNPAGARKWFLEVVDRGGGGRWADLGWRGVRAARGPKAAPGANPAGGTR